MQNPKKLLIRAPIILIVGGLAAYSVFQMPHWIANKKPASQFQVNKVVAVSEAAAQVRPIQKSVPLTGVVQSKDSIDITPTTGGTVSEVNVDIGQKVKVGDVLARLDSSVQEANLQEAEANVKSAQGKLTQQTSISDEQIEIARQNVELAQIKLDQLNNGPSDNDLKKAQLVVENAQRVYDSNKQYEDMLQNGDSADWVSVRKAQDTYDAVKEGSETAGATYRNTQSKITVDLDSSRQSLDAVTAPAGSLGQAVSNAKDDLRNAQEALNNYITLKAQSDAANPTAAQKNVYNYDAQLASLQKAVVSAQDDLAAAQANWSKAIVSATNSYNQAQATDTTAMELALKQRDQALQNAKNALDMAKANQMEGLQKAQQQVVTANNGLLTAQSNLEALQAPPDKYDVATAQANLAKAQSQLNLLIHPDDEGNVQSLQAGVDAAQARADQAQEALDRMTVQAPFDGTITQRNVSVGSAAQQGRAMFTLMGDVKEIVAQVDEQHLGAIRVGNTATYTVASAPDKTFQAEVYQISPTANVQTLTFNVILIPKDNSAKLVPGETVSLDVVTSQIPKALMIPSSAIVNQNGHPQVFVINDKSVVSLKDVDLGYTDGAETQIVKGLKEGQNVVTMGQSFLGTGDKVQIDTGEDAKTGEDGQEGADSGKAAGDDKAAANGANGAKAGNDGAKTDNAANAGQNGGKAGDGAKAGGAKAGNEANAGNGGDKAANGANANKGNGGNQQQNAGGGQKQPAKGKANPNGDNAANAAEASQKPQGGKQD